jgi:Spherulation-specific family 4
VTTGANKVLPTSSTLSPSGVLHKANTGIIVPFYFDPFKSATGLDELHSLMNISREYSLVPIVAVINPANGPGNYSTDMANTVGNLSGSGITVLGYIWTGYGAVNSTLIEHQIDEYHSWYANKSLTGILFDGMNGTAADKSYYATLASYAKINDSFARVFGNPGIGKIQSDVGTVDTINIYEGGPWSLDNGSFMQSPGNWNLNYYKGNFSAIALGANSFFVTQANVWRASTYLGYMYITNGTGANPYDFISPYVSTIASYLNVSSVSLNIDSELLNGTSLQSMNDVIYSGAYKSNDEIMNVTSPYSFNATEGWAYVVHANSTSQYVFNHWSLNGANYTASTITVTPTQATNLTAYYSTFATLKVESINGTGK